MELCTYHPMLGGDGEEGRNTEEGAHVAGTSDKTCEGSSAEPRPGGQE